MIGRVKQVHAIGNERVDVVVGRQGRSGDAPNPLIVLPHGYKVRTPKANLHFCRIRVTETEDNAAVGMHLGRDNRRWRLRGWSLRRLVLRGGQNSEHQEEDRKSVV